MEMEMEMDMDLDMGMEVIRMTDKDNLLEFERYHFERLFNDFRKKKIDGVKSVEDLWSEYVFEQWQEYESEYEDYIFDQIRDSNMHY